MQHWKITYNKICRKKKLIFEQQQREKLSRLTDNPSDFWKQWKHFGDSHHSKSPPEKVSGKQWETYFKDLYKEHPTTPQDNPEMPGLDHDYYRWPLNKPFTKTELDKVIDKLKRNKAAGRDKILTEFIKAAPENIRKLLLRLLNIIYKTSIVPKDWCLGIINPIHKEGPKDDPDNYRGICIGSILSKILSTYAHEQQTCWILQQKQPDWQIPNRIHGKK